MTLMLLSFMSCALLAHESLFYWILQFGYMELSLPTPVSRPPSLEWHPNTVQHTLRAKAAGKAIPSGGHTLQCAGAIQGKEGRIQVFHLAKQLGSNKRVIHEQVKCSS
jgi:hypothetical protein